MITLACSRSPPPQGGGAKLFIADQNGHIEVKTTRLLGGATSLHVASQYSHVGVVRLLLGHRAYVEATFHVSGRNTRLHTHTRNPLP